MGQTERGLFAGPEKLSLPMDGLYPLCFWPCEAEPTYGWVVPIVFLALISLAYLWTGCTHCVSDPEKLSLPIDGLYPLCFWPCTLFTMHWLMCSGIGRLLNTVGSPEGKKERKCQIYKKQIIFGDILFLYYRQHHLL